MEQNKTGKYLKYAIGEIVLVMVGILLALQVNNWNERRKAEIKIDANTSKRGTCLAHAPRFFLL